MNILVTRHDKIGDFITMLPVCKVLKEQANHKVVVLCSKINVPFAKELEFIDGVIEYREDKGLIKEIKSYNFDVSISGFIDTNLGKILWKSGIKKRIAPATKLAQIFFNRRIKQRRSRVEMREFEYNLALLKGFDANLKLTFNKPLWDLGEKRENFIIFHPGFGGSSDGNLTLNDYLNLARVASKKIKVVFSFGPDDMESKKYIEQNLNFEAEIKDDFKDIVEFAKYIAKSKLFVSTSTGPMHLAGLTNTPILSFFGNTLFASAKRWGTVSDERLQNNFTIPNSYSKELYNKIENRLLELISE